MSVASHVNMRCGGDFIEALIALLDGDIDVSERDVSQDGGSDDGTGGDSSVSDGGGGTNGSIASYSTPVIDGVGSTGSSTFRSPSATAINSESEKSSTSHVGATSRRTSHAASASHAFRAATAKADTRASDE